MPVEVLTAPSWPHRTGSTATPKRHPVSRRNGPVLSRSPRARQPPRPHTAAALPGRRASDLLSPQDWLATASSQPLSVLCARLTGLTEADRDATRQRRHARPACRFCMARRGVYEPVYCWFPSYLAVCRRHCRWVGPGTRIVDDQRDLRTAPAVMAAAYRHARLHRDHNDAAQFAIKDAARVLRWWSASSRSGVCGAPRRPRPSRCLHRRVPGLD